MMVKLYIIADLRFRVNLLYKKLSYVTESNIGDREMMALKFVPKTTKKIREKS